MDIPLRAQVDAFAEGEGFPVAGFRIMVALASCALIAPLLHVLRSETSRTPRCPCAGCLRADRLCRSRC